MHRNMVDYIRQLSGPEIFRASFSIYFSNWRAMISIYFLPVLPALVLESLFEAQKSVGLTLILNLCCSWLVLSLRLR